MTRLPRCHDPRISNIRWDKRETRNAALIRADIDLEQGVDVDWEAVVVAADNYDWPMDANGQARPRIWGLKEGMIRRDEAAAGAYLVRKMAMAKPREFKNKQPGSAGAKQPMAAVRIPVDLVNRIDHWAGEHDAQTRVEAICKLVEIGLTAKDALPANNTLRKRAATLAGSEIDRMGDSTVTTEERATRKRRLTEGPSAFRDTRRDRPSRR